MGKRGSGAFIPGLSEPTNLKPCIEPLSQELEEINAVGGRGFSSYDGVTRCIHVHLVRFSGGLLAVKKVAGFKEHKRTQTYCEKCSNNYYPAKMLS